MSLISFIPRTRLLFLSLVSPRKKKAHMHTVAAAASSPAYLVCALQDGSGLIYMFSEVKSLRKKQVRVF